MQLTIIAISLGCLMYGFSLLLTFFVTLDKAVLRDKRRMIGCVIGVILLIVGLIIFPMAF